MSRYRKNSHPLRDRDADTQNRLLGQDIFALERESPSPFDSPSPVHYHAHLSPLNVANPFLDAADADAEVDEPMGAFLSTAPIPMTNLPSSISEAHLNPHQLYDNNRPADYAASSSTMTSTLGLANVPANNTLRPKKRSQPHSHTHTQPRLLNIKETAKSNKQPFSSSSRLTSSNMNNATYPLPVISTSYTYSSGSSLASTASPSSSSPKSNSSTVTSTSTVATSSASDSNSNSDSLTSVVKRRPSPFPLGPVPPPPPPRRKHNEVKPHIVDIAVETFQLDTQTVSKPKPLTASMRRRNPPRLESYEDEEVMVPTPVKPYSLEIAPAYARRRRNESESSNAPSAPKSAIQLERETLWKQFEAEQIRSPDFTPTSKRTSRICQEKSITTAPITTFSTVTAIPATTLDNHKPSAEKKSEKPAKKSKRKWWSCFGGGGVESDQEVVVNEKR